MKIFALQETHDDAPETIDWYSREEGRIEMMADLGAQGLSFKIFEIEFEGAVSDIQPALELAGSQLQN